MRLLECWYSTMDYVVKGSFSIREVRSVRNEKVLALEEPEQFLLQETGEVIGFDCGVSLITL